MKTLGVIPARYASTRFPGKPLAVIAGKTMIQRVYERASQARRLDELLVATDDERIAGCVRAFGGRVRMTSASCASGTDRVAEVAVGLEQYGIVVNIQGDEPLLEPENLDAAVELMLSTPGADITTLARPADPAGEADDPNKVKVVLAGSGRALYFSRSPVPYAAGTGRKTPGKDTGHLLIHIGIYVYRREVLLELCRLPRAELEVLESLEQLRALNAGFAVFAARVEGSLSVGVDTAEDLARVERELARLGLE
ncbi:MAG: 3-deoxy-manno-octulosonate cytidylyltransferase [Candidatus Glassbacteria bacterium]|nr:3-deoxy-manno-octulosonate cytidylyltransferase [Candidatus Glassbacteria bacterium]